MSGLHKDDPCALGGQHANQRECDGQAVRCLRCGMAFVPRPVAARLAPKSAPSSRPSVKVRIAVMVDSEGRYGAASHGDQALEDYENVHGCFVTPRHVVIVEANVPLPLPEEPPVVQGEVVS